MSAAQIVLYDIPTRPPTRCWSLNPWKTRFLLNYKGLDYRTQWTEYPDLKPTLESKFPADANIAQYTSPTVQLEDGTFVTESRTIAEEIEKRHPKPSVHLDDPKLDKIQKLVPEVTGKLAGVFIPRVHSRNLSEPSQEYFRSTREKRFGITLEQLAEQKGGDDAWVNAKPYLESVTTLLTEDQSGPFFLGKEISYTDFVWGSLLLFFSKLGDDVWQRLLKESGNGDVHLKLLEALKPWCQRDDH